MPQYELLSVIKRGGKRLIPPLILQDLSDAEVIELTAAGAVRLCNVEKAAFVVEGSAGALDEAKADIRNLRDLLETRDGQLALANASAAEAKASLEALQAQHEGTKKELADAQAQAADLQAQVDAAKAAAATTKAAK